MSFHGFNSYVLLRRDKYNCSGLKSTHWAFKNLLWVVVAVTSMRTEQLSTLRSTTYIKRHRFWWSGSVKGVLYEVYWGKLSSSAGGMHFVPWNLNCTVECRLNTCWVICRLTRWVKSRDLVQMSHYVPRITVTVKG